MPGLARGVSIHAGLNGLTLRSTGLSAEGTASAQILYGTSKIAPISSSGDDDAAHSVSVESHGIAGLLDLDSNAYLIAITGREEVAKISGKQIYGITDVTLIPLASKTDAEHAVSAAQKVAKQGLQASAQDGEESDVGEDAEPSAPVAQGDEVPEEIAALEPAKADGVVQKGTDLVKSVVPTKPAFGLFADRWFSKGKKKAVSTRGPDLTKEQKDQAPQAEQTTTMKDIDEPKPDDPAEAVAQNDTVPSPTASKQTVLQSLTPRIVRSTKLYLSSSGFYFSYDYDLSAKLTSQDPTSSSSALYQRFDPLFFWNHHLLSPLIDAGLDTFALPLLQGFVGQRTFSIARTPDEEQDIVAGASSDATEGAAKDNTAPVMPEKAQHDDFVLTLISRRSVKRAGLRYLRRGIDEAGNVANNVETEQILSPQSSDGVGKTFSLVQIRGSIPLFFSQTPYSFKPVPVLFGSEATNQTAFKKHLEAVTSRHGPVQIASLIDKHGTEVSVGTSFEHHAKLLNDSGGINDRPIGFEWFDFHSACKGVKFENVSLLLDTLQDSLKTFGWNVSGEGKIVTSQAGVLRTNCMDCLDRTNVVQSAVGGWALQQQLAVLGLQIDLKTDAKTQWFNTLWADNGDKISKQYAGTAALKGDFTRTRKRAWAGALTDFTLTINRYYNNIFSDYFLQLCIDFYLGSTGLHSFEAFEADMQSQDYAVDIGRIRQNAIDACVKIVLEDPNEKLIGGWTLSCPREANTLRSLPFEECVLLLTNAAIYFCRFDWNAEKVGSFERVELLDLTDIWRGAYITSTLGPTNLDPARNVGFAVRYTTKKGSIVRTNTRSLGNEHEAKSENAGKSELEKQKSPTKDESRLLAFKAQAPQDSAAKKEDAEKAPALSEVELVKHICDEVHRLTAAAVQSTEGFDHLALDKVLRVQEKDVVSAADARKSTGYVEAIGYGLKKMVWS